MKTPKNLDSILFYSLEKAIKTYRQFAQRSLNETGLDITIDQWLVLKALEENPGQSQHQIAEATFKDHASLTRIIELLVKKNHLERTMHPTDRRRFKLTVTGIALKLLNDAKPIIEKNRQTALQHITPHQADSMRQTLLKITDNCKI